MLQNAAEHKRTIAQMLAFAGMSGLHSMKWFCLILLTLAVLVFWFSVLLVLLYNPVIAFFLGAMLLAVVAVIGLPAAFIAGFASGMLCAVLEPRESYIPVKYWVLTWIGTGALFVAAILWAMPTHPRLQTVGFQDPVRLDIPLFSVLRFSSDSKSFFTVSHRTLYHYDLNGNILGQVAFNESGGESIDDFYLTANGEELGVLVSQRFWGGGQLVDIRVDFIVVNVQSMTVARRINLLSDNTGNLGRRVIFSPATKSWIVYCLAGKRNEEKHVFFALQSDTLKIQAETIVDHLGRISIYPVPGLDGTIAIDAMSNSLLWNYQSNELTNNPARVSSYRRGAAVFSGPFPRTIATLGTHHENDCFLVFPSDSGMPSHYSAPLALRQEMDWGWQIAGISDDFKTALFFYHRPVMLAIPPPQRILVVDVPSMRIIAERTSRTPFIREVFLSPNGKYVAVASSTCQRRGTRISTSFHFDIYEVSGTEPRPSEQWREINRP